MAKQKINKAEGFTPRFNFVGEKETLAEVKIEQGSTVEPEIKTIKATVEYIKGRPFVRIFGWGIFLEETSKKENTAATKDVTIVYQGEITPQNLNWEVISW